MPTNDVVLSEEQRVELGSIAQSRSSAGRICVSRQADPDAGRGCVLSHHQAAAANHSADDHPLEAAVPGIPAWMDWIPIIPAKRASVLTPALAGQDSGGHSQETQRWFHALELPQAGRVRYASAKTPCIASGKRPDLKPHRLERYMASDDPEFEAKAADIIGLYLNPPQHAAVFCVDEKTAIQALDRLDPVLPLSPGRAERHGFEYYRHGTLSLYAALDTATGRVHGKTAARHTSREFVDFLEEVVLVVPAPASRFTSSSTISSAHKTQSVQDFLEQNPRVQFHFTPTYSSWLNQVELWFAKIERDVIARGIFTSVPDLARKLRRYINAYSANARPIRWKYSDPSRRIRSNELTATGH